MKAYNPKITPWQIKEQDFPHNGSGTEQLCFLLRYAILAPSSHNTQPWKFSVSRDEIRVFVDLARWLKVADADQRELYISMGCALENLLIAAEHFGYGCQFDLLTNILKVQVTPESGWLILVVRGKPAQLEAGLVWIAEQGVQVEIITEVEEES